MPRERARRDSSPAAAAATDTRVWGKRFSLGTSTGRLLDTTQAFRDLVKVDYDIRRRFSSGTYSSKAGATRTFRDPTVNVDTFGTKARDSAASRSSAGGKSGDAFGRHITAQEATSDSPAAGEEWSSTTGNTTRPCGRQASLQRWMANKTAASLENTGQWSELHDINNENGPDGDSSYDEEQRQGCHAGVNDVELLHASRGAIEPALDRGDKNDGAVSSTRRVLQSEKSRSGITCSDDQYPNTEGRATAAEFKDVYNDTNSDEASRQVTFLSGTMGLTVDIDDPMKPQLSDGLHSGHQPQNGHEEQWPASPCSGVILETSPRYGTLQAFRKEMSSRGFNAQVGILAARSNHMTNNNQTHRQQQQVRVDTPIHYCLDHISENTNNTRYLSCLCSRSLKR